MTMMKKKICSLFVIVLMVFTSILTLPSQVPLSRAAEGTVNWEQNTDLTEISNRKICVNENYVFVGDNDYVHQYYRNNGTLRNNISWDDTSPGLAYGLDCNNNYLFLINSLYTGTTKGIIIFKYNMEMTFLNSIDNQSWPYPQAAHCCNETYLWTSGGTYDSSYNFAFTCWEINGTGAMNQKYAIELPLIAGDDYCFQATLDSTETYIYFAGRTYATGMYACKFWAENGTYINNVLISGPEDTAGEGVCRLTDNRFVYQSAASTSVDAVLAGMDADLTENWQINNSQFTGPYFMDIAAINDTHFVVAENKTGNLTIRDYTTNGTIDWSYTGFAANEKNAVCTWVDDDVYGYAWGKNSSSGYFMLRNITLAEEGGVAPPDPPSSFVATGYNTTQINITWVNATGSNAVYIRNSTTNPGVWYRTSTGDELQNVTSANHYEHGGLGEGQSMYYAAWTYSATNGWSTSYATSNSATTSTIPSWVLNDYETEGGSTSGYQQGAVYSPETNEIYHFGFRNVTGTTNPPHILLKVHNCTTQAVSSLIVFPTNPFTVGSNMCGADWEFHIVLTASIDKYGHIWFVYGGHANSNYPLSCVRATKAVTDVDWDPSNMNQWSNPVAIETTTDTSYQVIHTSANNTYCVFMRKGGLTNATSWVYFYWSFNNGTTWNSRYLAYEHYFSKDYAYDPEWEEDLIFWVTSSSKHNNNWETQPNSFIYFTLDSVVNNAGAYGSNQTPSDTPYYSFPILPGDIRTQDEIGGTYSNVGHTGPAYDSSNNIIYVLMRNDTHLFLKSKTLGSANDWTTSTAISELPICEESITYGMCYEYVLPEEKLFIGRAGLDADPVDYQIGNSSTPMVPGSWSWYDVTGETRNAWYATTMRYDGSTTEGKLVIDLEMDVVGVSGTSCTNGIHECGVKYYTYSGGGPPPSGNFTWIPNVNITIQDTIQFSENVTGTPTAYNWSFGDGTWSTSQNPAHSYDWVGNYTVTFRWQVTGVWYSESATLSVGRNVTVYYLPSLSNAGYNHISWTSKTTIMASELADLFNLAMFDVISWFNITRDILNPSNCWQAWIVGWSVPSEDYPIDQFEHIQVVVSVTKTARMPPYGVT